MSQKHGEAHSCQLAKFTPCATLPEVIREAGTRAALYEIGLRLVNICFHGDGGDVKVFCLADEIALGQFV
jgi:hypothetical protein